MTPVWRGKVVNGEFKPDRPEDYKKHLEHLEGRRVEQVIERRRQKRSLPQNAWYWCVIVPKIAAAMGHDDLEEVHEILKEHFPANAELHEYLRMEKLRSTTQHTREQFTLYAERCQRLGAWLGTYVPDPNEVTTIEAEQFQEES